ncbi:hypothetical protein L2E82_06204 [Cichorium intybus]|uniref:Uncharacterized protein n=1 Tax=Cichorium intybus TaxID=13427 RepID=A0ACB9HA52_CICIN|nr:hypothetical protein L2E82_06204 [Cichorium intybus]
MCSSSGTAYDTDGCSKVSIEGSFLPRFNAASASISNPAAEAKAHRERKKKVLLKLKTKYQEEIHHWEHFSNTLKALQDHTQNQPSSTVTPDQTVSVLQENSSDSHFQDLTGTLLTQVLAYPSDQTVSVLEIKIYH